MVNPSEPPRPFVPAESRPDILRRLVVERQGEVTNKIQALIERQVTASADVLYAGKAGGSEFSVGGTGADKKDGGKDSGKDGGKDSKDKEKEGKEDKDSSDKGGGKEDKDSSDSTKIGGSESLVNPADLLVIYGDPDIINQGLLNQVAQQHIERLSSLIQSNPIM